MSLPMMMTIISWWWWGIDKSSRERHKTMSSFKDKFERQIRVSLSLTLSLSSHLHNPLNDFLFRYELIPSLSMTLLIMTPETKIHESSVLPAKLQISIYSCIEQTYKWTQPFWFSLSFLCWLFLRLTLALFFLCLVPCVAPLCCCCYLVE